MITNIPYKILYSKKVDQWNLSDKFRAIDKEANEKYEIGVLSIRKNNTNVLSILKFVRISNLEYSGGVYLF